MKAFIFMANGFEEVEALAPIDLLRRAGVEVSLVGVNGKTAVGARGVSVACDKEISEVLNEVPDMVILPGGNPGYINLGESNEVKLITEATYKAGKLVAAICGAPTVLSGYGILKGKTACVYPGLEKELDCEKVSFDPVCRFENVITSRGMGTSVEFALELVRALEGPEKAALIAKQVVFCAY